MSLSGLDTPAVDAAYQKVLEKGGWFFLRYTSRDAVDVLAQGVGGLVEMREAAATHSREDTGAPSPLFGMICFRRRRVLVKIILEGTSRLVQARAQVHWGSVTARFADHDSTCEIGAPEELTENALTANTDLHSSRSSANSGNQKMDALHEIEEGAEDTNGPIGKASPAIDTPKEEKLEVKLEKKPETSPEMKPITKSEEKSIAKSEEKPIKKSTPSIIEPSTEPFPSFNTTTEAHEPRLDSKSDYNITLTPSSDYSFPDPDRRLSSQSARRSGTDLFGAPLDFSFLEKPKVKLGPRPLLDKRMSSSRSSTDTRPTAALPTGLRSNRTNSGSRPKSRDSTKTLPAGAPSTATSTSATSRRFPAPPPIPETPPLPTTIMVPRPKSRGGSVKSLPATLPKGGMSKEKQRLMKFREMYKQKENTKGKSPVMPSPPIMEEAFIFAQGSAAAERKSDAPKAVNSQRRDPAGAQNDYQRNQAIQRNADGQVQSVDSAGNVELGHGAVKASFDNGAGKHDATDSNAKTEIEDAAIEQHPSSEALLGDSGRKTQEVGEALTHKSQRNSPIEYHVEDTGEQTMTIPQASRESAPTLFTKDDSRETESMEKTLVKSSAGEETRPPAGGSSHGESQSKEEARRIDAVKSEGNARNEIEDFAETPTTEEPAIHDMASPTSFLESLGQTSTRATSVSESNGQRSPGTVSRHSHKASDDITTVSANSLLNKQPLVEECSAQVPETSEPTPTALSPAAEKSPAVQESKIEEEAGRQVDEPVQSTERNMSTSTQMSAEPRVRQSSAQEHSTTEASSVADYDDDLVDELQAAIVEEAKPVAVSKTPISAILPRKGSITGFRAFSTPQKRNGAESVGTDSASSSPFGVRLRSVSSNLGASDKQDDKPSFSGKRVGGGIAAKIADLQRSFSRGSQSNPHLQTKDAVPGTKSVAQRASTLEPINTFSAPKRLSSLINRQSSPGDESNRERTPSPQRNSSNTLAVQQNTASTTSPVPSHASQILSTPRSESVSIRTTITRPDPSPMLIKGAATAPTSPEIPFSPTMASPSFHQRARSVVSSPRLFRPSGRSASVSSLRSPPTSPNPELFGFTQPSEAHSTGWRAIGTRIRRMSESRAKSPPPPVALPRSMSNSSLDTAASAESSKTDKKGSRTSRLFKRMSNSISSLATSPRIQLQTLSEKGAQELERQEVVRPKGITVGDLNVQFPDTLLWKRRWVEIDDAGYLVLKPSSSTTETLNGIIKRFHLSEFQPPFPPDLDRQELSNSIILDFRDGRTLQCACQSPLSQRQTLHLLLEYHMAWLT